MSSDELELSRTAVPRTRVEVRRRRYDGRTTWLVSRNDWFELDDVTDQVWLACEDGLAVDQIARRVAARSGLPVPEALAATVLAVDRFRELGLVEVGEP